MTEFMVTVIVSVVVCALTYLITHMPNPEVYSIALLGFIGLVVALATYSLVYMLHHPDPPEPEQAPASQQ